MAMDEDDNDSHSDRDREGPVGKEGPAKESERKKRELIRMGKAKGFLTYDEVNEHMPDSIISPNQMDDWLTTFSGEGIELVDAATKIKVGGKAEAATEAAEEAEDEGEPDGGDGEVNAKRKEKEKEKETAEPADEDEEEDSEEAAKNIDPVRLYLRKMGSVSLLSREGEVVIAKRMEEGERRVLQVVLNSSLAIEEILDLGVKLRQGLIRVKEVVKDADDEEA
ncbi:MAG: RNA polymerase sigma factor region1.1 domain-containing protein, partial [Myxococcales bacterium]